MNKRKLMLVAVALCMAAILLAGGTLAYLTDTDKETNTFTVGNVNIHIDEWKDDGDKTTKWEEFTNDQKLMPLLSEQVPQNKLVETVNDGSEPAYIRTYVTCPVEMYWDLGLGFNKQDKTLVGADYGMTGSTVHSLDNWAFVGVYIIEDDEVAVFVCDCEDIIPKGDSVLSLTKVWVYESVTSERLAELGLNKDGSNFPIQVASQAIQAEGFDNYAAAMAKLSETHTMALEQLYGEENVTLVTTVEPTK